MKNQKLVFKAIFICLLFLFHGPVEAKFINTYIFSIGGRPLYWGDVAQLAKHDIIFCNKNHYSDVGDTWGEIKKINPNAEIYLYTSFNIVRPYQDSYDIIALNTISIYSSYEGRPSEDPKSLFKFSYINGIPSFLSVSVHLVCKLKLIKVSPRSNTRNFLTYRKV